MKIKAYFRGVWGSQHKSIITTHDDTWSDVFKKRLLNTDYMYASGGYRYSILCDNSQRTPVNDRNKCISKCSNYSPV